MKGQIYRDANDRGHGEATGERQHIPGRCRPTGIEEGDGSRECREGEEHGEIPRVERVQRSEQAIRRFPPAARNPGRPVRYETT